MAEDVFQREERLAAFPWLVADPPADFQTGLDLCDFCWPNPFDLRQFMHGGLVDPLETAELAEKQASVINGRLARTGIAVSEDDCEQLGFGQSLCPFIQELLSGPILSGPILDSLVPSHRNLAVWARLIDVSKCATADFVYHTVGISPIP